MNLDLLDEMIKTTQESLSKRGLEGKCSVRLILSHDVIAVINARCGILSSYPPKSFNQYMGLPFSEGKETQIIVEEEKFGKGKCYAYCEVDGENLVSTEALQEEVYKQQTIIEFLKKELIKKTSYRQVMKRQYRELKQQMKADNERHTRMYAELVTKKQSITWHYLEGNPKDLPQNEGWVCNQDGLPCWYDIANDQWIDCEGTQIKTTAWCDMPHTKE